MASQTDLDQGGTYRQFVRRFLGPSVGWVWTPEDSVLPVTGASATVVWGTTVVTVDFNGAVGIQLPSSKAPGVAAGAVPGGSLILPVTIIDVGGFASVTNIITITPFGTETIDGLTTWTITNPYGRITLTPPDLTSGGWNA
ncbi:MAG: hypothetical protein KGL39_54915 [Patescibacteria group bacterium]|nr:hypothetical protein [Patescibacteria group bacterium]